MEGQIGLEPTPDEFVACMVEVFREVRRVLRPDGICFCNLGDSFEDKQLQGMPWRVALALQADGWWLRDAIVWAKPSPMPGSQRDRCTSAYEMIFQLTKASRYFWDMEAVKERAEYGFSPQPEGKIWNRCGVPTEPGRMAGSVDAGSGGTRIPRNVWTIASEGFSEAHFATYPTELPRRCIKAACSEKGCCPECGKPWERVVSEPEGGAIGQSWHDHSADGETGNAKVVSSNGYQPSRTLGWQPTCQCENGIAWNQGTAYPTVPCRVLDPFGGAGTTAIAACQLGHDATLIELNPAYAKMARERIAKALSPSTARADKAIDSPLFEAIDG